MPRTVLENERRSGEGIYAKKKKKKQFNDERDTIETEAKRTDANQPHCLKANFGGKFSSSSSSISCQSDSIGTGHLKVTQQVLDVLDQQINTLNEFKRRTSTETNKLQIYTCESGSNYSHNYIGNYLATKKETDLFVTTAQSSDSNDKREFLLNHYLRHSIDETGECGCHFELELDSDDVKSSGHRLTNETVDLFYAHDNIECVRNLQFGSEERSLLLAGIHCQSGSENPIECDEAREKQQQQLQLSIGSEDENYGSLDVCLGLPGNSTRTIDSCFGCCKRHGYGELLIDDRLNRQERGFEAASEFERDLEQASQQHQQLNLTGVRAEQHECICGIWCDRLSSEGSPLVKHNCFGAERDHNNYSQVLEAIEDPANTFGSSIVADENCAIGTSQAREQQSSPFSSFSVEFEAEQEDEERESCGESEIGNALEGIVDSLNGEHSPSNSPFFTQPFATPTIEAETCQRINPEHKLELLLGSSTIEHQANHCSRGQHPLGCGLSNDSILSLSCLQNFPSSNNNNIETTKDKQNYDLNIRLNLRRQLYSELNGKFLARKLHLNSVGGPEDSTVDLQNNLAMKNGSKLAAEEPHLVSDYHNHEDAGSLSSPNETIDLKAKNIIKHEHNASSSSSSRGRDEKCGAALAANSEGKSYSNLNYYHRASDARGRVVEKSSNAPSKTCTANELNSRVAQQGGEAEISMKTAKDIAKLSIPSLSSLQYLPNQIDKQNSKLKQQIHMETKIMSPQKVKPAGQQMQMSGQSVRVITAESREDIQHESGLLHNLCLCNCMAKSHNVDADSGPRRRAAQGSKCEEKRRSDSSRDVASLSSSLKADLKRRSSVRSSKSSRASETTSPPSDELELSPSPGDNKKQDFRVEEEKQSPSFLNILKSSAHISHNFRQHLPRGLGGSEQSGGGLVSGRVASGNSVGDLEATESCCSSGRDSVDTNATSGSSFMRAHSASFVSSGREEEEEEDSQHYHGHQRASSYASTRDDENNSPSVLLTDPTTDSGRAHSACSTRQLSDNNKESEHSKRGSSNRRRFQSFFRSPVGSHRGSLKRVDESKQQQQQQHQKRISKSPERTTNTKEKSNTNEQQSFFTKSLNRLSNRRKRYSPDEREPLNHHAGAIKSRPSLQSSEHQDNEKDNDSLRARSTCLSPTISISTVNSKREESITDSMNSLEDELALPEFAPSPSPRLRSSSLLKPERANRVNRGQLHSDSQSCLSSTASCDMTRAKSCNVRTRGQGAASARSCIYEPTATDRIVRYGSEISYYTSDNGSERAYSLPASPHGLRRDLCAIQNRSPRLTQSPVPFPSPANESTKIEDGLKVCSTEHFEKHIGNIKGTQIEAQKKLFKAWINYYCPKLIQRDLVDELRDGIKLIGLLASLTRDKKLLIIYEKLVRDKQAYINRLVITPTSRLRHVSNVSIAIEYLRKNLGMKMINLNPMDVVSGKPNVTLGLCWNIILNFQLEQNFSHHPESTGEAEDSIDHSTDGGDSASNCTSRLSYPITNEDCSRGTRQLSVTNKRKMMAQMEDYSVGDLVEARKKLLDHINEKFNLKLTNLTSNLLDGDVLSVIIKQLAPQVKQDFADRDWKAMSNDEKLDYCFDVAQNCLQVPQLFSASDLKYQIETNDHSKPLLVYLSMLIKTPELKNTNPLGTKTNLSQVPEGSQTSQDFSLEARIRNYINEIDRDDKFELDKLQSTLTKIKKLDQTLNDSEQIIDENLMTTCRRLVDEANQVESLISWINQADNLFETKHKSVMELTDAIDEYRKFFSPDNVPEVKITLCPTLERQYRECLGSAKQRVLLMEQTLKNWDGYEKARRQLREWLSTAELKLADAVRPAGTEAECDTIEYHTQRLEDLIDYFELEPIDSILVNESLDGPNASFMNYRLPSLESLPLSMSVNESISGSVLSIGSTSSRISTLQSSKKATYNKLFEDFELKCLLLASQLDQGQKEALLMGVRELKYRLRHITEQRVPQMVSELKFNISRCEMSIEEQDESKELKSQEVRTSDMDSSDDVNEDSLLVDSDILSNEESAQLLSVESSTPRGDENAIKASATESLCESLQNSLDTHQGSIPIGAQEITSSDKQSLRSYQDQIEAQPDKKLSAISTQKPVSKGAKSSKNTGQKLNKSKESNNKGTIMSNNGLVKVSSTDSKPNESWSILKWFLAGKKDKEPEVIGVKRGKPKRKSRATNKPNNRHRNKIRAKSVADKSKVKTDEQFPDDITYTRLFWSKLIRAYRASMPLNIILLICLAGVCVLPLIHKDACCELTHNHIPTEDFSLNQKPT